MILLTHWGRVTHICVSKLTISGSDNSLSPERRQAIIWTNAGLLFIRPLGTNFNEMLLEILTFSFKKLRLNVSSAKRRPFCLGLNVLFKISSDFNFQYVLSSSDSRPQSRLKTASRVNTLRPRQNGRHFPDDILKCIFMNEKCCILIRISLKFVPKGPINNIPALVWIMAWCWPGVKPLSEPIVVRLQMHICVTWPQWINCLGLHAWLCWLCEGLPRWQFKSNFILRV